MKSPAPDFARILDLPIDQIQRPQPLPKGTYLMQCKGHPELIKSSKKGTPGVKFTFVFVSADEDIDPAAIEAAGGLKGKTLSSNDTTYWITDGSAFRLRDFLIDTLELPEVDEDSGQPTTASQLLPMTANRQFWAKIDHRVSESDPKSIFMEIAQMAPLSTGTGDDEDEAEAGGEFDEDE